MSKLPTSDELLAAIPPPDLATPVQPRSRLDDVPVAQKAYIEAAGKLAPVYIIAQRSDEHGTWYLVASRDTIASCGWVHEKGIRDVE